MLFVGPKPNTTNRIATKDEITGGTSTPYNSYVISADLTIPTDNSMCTPAEFYIRSTAGLFLQGTAIFQIY